jgi:hypothetical protein
MTGLGRVEDDEGRSPQQRWLALPSFTHPGDIRQHPVEDCEVCVRLGSWADCEDSQEWLVEHRRLWDAYRGDGEG